MKRLCFALTLAALCLTELPAQNTFPEVLEADTVLFFSNLEPDNAEGHVQTTRQGNTLHLLGFAPGGEETNVLTHTQLDLNTYGSTSRKIGFNLIADYYPSLNDFCILNNHLICLNFFGFFKAPIQDPVLNPYIIIPEHPEYKLPVEGYNHLTVASDGSLIVGEAYNHMHFKTPIILVKYRDGKPVKTVRPQIPVIGLTHFITQPMDMHNGKTLLFHISDYRIDIYDEELEQTATITRTLPDWRHLHQSTIEEAEKQRLKKDANGVMRALMDSVARGMSAVTDAKFVSDSLIMVNYVKTGIFDSLGYVDFWRLKPSGDWTPAARDLMHVRSAAAQLFKSYTEKPIPKDEYYTGSWNYGNYKFFFAADRLFILGAGPRFMPWGRSYTDYMTAYKAYFAENDPVVTLLIFKLKKPGSSVLHNR